MPLNLTGKLINPTGEHIKPIQFSQTITMTANSQSSNLFQLPVYQKTVAGNPVTADIVGIYFNFNVLATGTLSTAKTIDNAINSINITDVKGSNVTTNIVGTDAAKFIYLASSGSYVTPATTSGSAQNFSGILPIQINRNDQPASISWGIAPYSALASSGATGGTVAINFSPLYVASASQVPTSYVMKQALTLNSGANTFGINLAKGLLNYCLFATVGTESNLTNVTFEAAGGVGQEQRVFQDFIAQDQQLFPISGHQTGYMDFNTQPFICSLATVLNVTGAGSDTFTVYQFQHKTSS